MAALKCNNLWDTQLKCLSFMYGRQKYNLQPQTYTQSFKESFFIVDEGKDKYFPFYDMNSYRGRSCIAPPILNLGTRWCELSPSCLTWFTHQKSLLYPFNRRLGGFQWRSRRSGGKKIVFPLTRIELRIWQPVLWSLRWLGYTGSSVVIRNSTIYNTNICVVVLVICVLVFTVLCIVCTVFFIVSTVCVCVCFSMWGGSLSPRHGASSDCGWRNGLRYGG